MTRSAHQPPQAAPSAPPKTVPEGTPKTVPDGTPKTVPDAAVRERALDAGTSFIVQAPAGSGKTALLIQRLLVLLAQADQPEEVAAITFTRKAATEMRVRLLQALESAAGAAPQKAGFEHETWQRARAVLARDKEADWRLLDNPGRLRIGTIDAFCGQLTRQAPLASRLGASTVVAERPGHLHLEAARATLAAMEGVAPVAAQIARLVAHLDNRPGRAESLLGSMLARRDQWLRHLPGPDDPTFDAAALRQSLERELAAAVEEALVSAADAWRSVAQSGAGEVLDALPHLLAHAAAHAPSEDSPLKSLAGLTGLPGADISALAQWQALAGLLLTKSGGVRARVTIAEGFPADKSAGDVAVLKARKEEMKALLDTLRAAPALVEHLALLPGLPEPHYAERQWEVLLALLRVLPHAVEALQAAFRAAGEVDFTEVALATLRTLNSGAGAAVVGGIRHLLVDEFQDTSFAQFALLEHIVAVWQAEAGGQGLVGRTLFLVGDPMQSIYRFREAEVGLFLRARRAGLGGMSLEALTLRTNFRSQAGVVAWVNGVFPGVLAVQEDPSSGAVPYSASLPFHGDGAEPPVQLHVVPETKEAGRARADAAEAAQVVRVLRETLVARPEGSVGVLVRGRRHLEAIVAALQTEGIGFVAVNIDPLGGRSAVKDVLALCRALLDPADRIAWLSVLRAPWCGLDLADLLALSGGAEDRGILWARLTDSAVLAQVSADGRVRLQRLTTALAPALERAGRMPLRGLVEGAWLALGAPACFGGEEGAQDGSAQSRAEAEACFARLEAIDESGLPLTVGTLDEALEDLYAPPHPLGDPRVQLLTIHRAKGLEFDTVLLPGLGRPPRGDDSPLLRWQERPLPAPGGAGLLLAPVSEDYAEEDKIYSHLKHLEAVKGKHEVGRLLYVAATRARQQLHLFSSVRVGDKGPQAPPASSLLHLLWPALEADALAQLETGPVTQSATPADSPPAVPTAPAPVAPALHRLPAGWLAPTPPASVRAPLGAEVAGEEPADGPAEGAAVESLAPEFSWAGEVARQVGTVVHRILRRLAHPEVTLPEPGAVAAMGAHVRNLLAQQGLPPQQLEPAVAKALAALRGTVEDARGRWLLSDHADAAGELEITGVLEGRPRRFVIDRTFVDEDGVRWIVDYKTGGHEGGSTEAFLNQEQERYRPQLENYARLMGRLDPGRPMRLCLYFPLLGALREWDAPRGEA